MVIPRFVCHCDCRQHIDLQVPLYRPGWQHPVVKYAPFGACEKGMASSAVNLYNGSCPSRNILELIGSKWSMLVVCRLRDGPLRTGVLKREIDGISQKILTQTLRDLERHGIVQRIDYAEVPPRVEYRLTRLGQSLGVLVLQIEEWVTHHYSRMTTVARSYDAAERLP